MNLGTALRVRHHEIERALQVAKKVLAEPRARGLVPVIGFGDVVSGERCETDVPTHRRWRRAFS